MFSRVESAAGRYDANGLRDFATERLEQIGLAKSKAGTVAEILLEGDLLGHTTHGLQLLPHYLAALEKKTMAARGRARDRLGSRRGDRLGWALSAGPLARRARHRCAHRA